MTLIAGHTPEIKAWVENKLPNVDDFGLCEGIGVLSSNRLICGVIYHNYRPKYGSIEMSIASISPMWARKENIKAFLDYPFKQLGCYRVYACIEFDNDRAQKTVGHIGFKREAICHSMFGKGKHGVVMRMLKPDYDKLYGDKCLKANHQLPPR